MADMDVRTNWLTLYREAVLEDDPKKLRVRVAQAQRAIRHRARELWYSAAPDTTERRQMDAAAHFLGLLHAIGASK